MPSCDAGAVATLCELQRGLWQKDDESASERSSRLRCPELGSQKAQAASRALSQASDALPTPLQYPLPPKGPDVEMGVRA